MKLLKRFRSSFVGGYTYDMLNINLQQISNFDCNLITLHNLACEARLQLEGCDWGWMSWEGAGWELSGWGENGAGVEFSSPFYPLHNCTQVIWNKKKKILPLLIPWDYIHKETLARSPWGHKVPDGQIIKAWLKYLYFCYSIETTGFKLITSCPVELRAIKQICDLQRDVQIISNIQYIT